MDRVIDMLSGALGRLMAMKEVQPSDEQTMGIAKGLQKNLERGGPKKLASDYKNVTPAIRAKLSSLPFLNKAKGK